MEIKQNNLFVGVSKESITPALGTELYGYPLPLRCAERVMDPISVGAIAVKQGEDTVIYISAEVCLFKVPKASQMRKVISDATGIKYENVILGCIHTHSGPITSGSTGWGAANTDFIDNFFLPRAVKVAQEAVSRLQPAVMGLGISETMAGINRRQIDENGNVILGQNPEGPYDPTMTLICFKSPEGKHLGSMVHFAAHPTAAGRNPAFTRDWPGLVIDKVEELTGAMCIFFNGAEGDVGPRLSNGETTGGEEHVIEAGLIAAADIEKAYKNIDNYIVPKMKIHYGTIFLPYITPYTREFTEARIREFEENPETIEGVRASLYDQLKRLKTLYDSGEELPRGNEILQTVVSLGDIAIVPAPFEAFCNIALAIREGSPYKHTIMLGLTNGTYGYLPTEDQLSFGGYEVDSFRTIGTIGMVDDADKHFITQNVKLLNEIYNK